MNFNSYSIGDIVASPRAEGVTLDIYPDGAILLIAYNGITCKEQEEISEGQVQFKLAIANNILFFLSKFGDLPWQDSPFASNLASVDLNTFKNIPENMGLSLHVMLIEAATGKLVINRIIGLSSYFTRSFIDLALKHPAPSDRIEYQQLLLNIYSRYSTDQLVDMATCTN